MSMNGPSVHAEDVVVCPSCRAEVPDGARFCPNCAAPVANPGQTINTGGGAFVGGSVRAGHDFVGRDQVSQAGLTGDEIGRLFQEVYRSIDGRPADPKVDQDEIEQIVRRIEAEIKKGEQSNPDRLERWLKTLGELAPDIFNVTVTALANPVAGVAQAVQIIARKFKTSSGSTGTG
jgi:hypothetical protein